MFSWSFCSVELWHQRSACHSSCSSSAISRIDQVFGAARIPDKTPKLNRRILTQMNVAQLQVILNFFLSQIETLNEDLVRYLMARDELVIEQDSLLTDIEDITKCISAVATEDFSD